MLTTFETRDTTDTFTNDNSNPENDDGSAADDEIRDSENIDRDLIDDNSTNTRMPTLKSKTKPTAMRTYDTETTLGFRKKKLDPFQKKLRYSKNWMKVRIVTSLFFKASCAL